MKDRNLFKMFGMLRSAPQRDVKAAAAARQRYMQQVDGYLAHSKRPVAAKRLTFFSQKNFAMAFVTSLLLFVFLFTSGAGVVAAAQGTLPGEALYPVKTLSEDVRLALTTNINSKFDLLASYVMNRINEIDTLQETGAVLPVNITGRIGSQLDAMLTLVASMDDANMTTALVDMQKMLMGQYMKLGTTGDQDRIQDNFQVMLHVMILKQNRDYLDLTTLGLTDPTGLRNMYAYNGVNKPEDAGSGSDNSGGNAEPGNLNAIQPGPGEGSENSFGPGYITTVVTDDLGITTTVTLPGTWGPGAAGGIVLTDVLTTTHYGVGPDEPLNYDWGDGPYGTPSEEPSQYKQMDKHTP